MLGSLRGKIILSFCVLMLVGGSLSTTLVSRNMSVSLGRAVDRNGMALARVLADLLSEPLAYGDRLTIRRVLTGALESNADVSYTFITDPSGVVRNHSFPLDGFPGDLLSVAPLTIPATLRTEAGLVRDVPFPISQGVLGTLHLGISMSWVDATTAEAVGNVLLTTLLAMVAGVVGILFLANLITRPVLALRDAADRLGRGQIDAQAPVEGADEIADLARTFNRMSRQIQDRVAESEALRAFRERVLDQLDSGIIVVSESLEVEHANRAVTDRHGALEGTVCSAAMSAERPCDQCPVPEVLSTGVVVRRRYRSPTGRTYEMKWLPVLGRDGSPAVVERALEVTEQVELNERYQQARRLAVAGEISAGIVHSVNNPLDGVRRALDLAESRPDDRERVQRMLALAREGTDRIAGITRTLLDFARGTAASDRVSIDVSSLVEAAVNLTRLRADAQGVEIQVDVDDALPRANVDPSGVEEVLTNLLLNAVDACEGGGTVSLEASLLDGDLAISVRDTGSGVPPDVAGLIFDPFFTTKEAGRGTGLGLPVARRIVEAHGGELELARTNGGGTTFTMTIPLSGKGSPRGTNGG